MIPERISGFRVSKNAAVIGGKTYKLELLTDDESIAETYNGGEALPLMDRGDA